MAVAVQNSGSAGSANQAKVLGLLPVSIIGAVVVLGAAALILNIIPMLFGSGTPNRSMGVIALQILAQFAAIIGFGFAVAKLGAGHLKTAGVRGGVFFTLVAGLIIAFCALGIYRIIQRGLSPAGIIAMLLLVVAVFFVVQFFRTGRFASWALAMDQGNWFDTNSFKRTQGLKVRRLTTLGILLLFGSGIWTLWTHDYLPHNATVKVQTAEGLKEIDNRMGDWVIGGTLHERPAHVTGGFTLLPDLAFTIPMILTALTVWFAWRAVNFPPFADFLIATEAEINKVSWSSRKSLIRDTIVVLVSLVLITLFLFVVDVFWGFLLSREWVSVLPTEEERKQSNTAVVSKPIDW